MDEHRADGRGVAAVDHALALPSGDGRGLEVVLQLAQDRSSTVGPATQDHQRMFGLSKQAGGLGHELGIGTHRIGNDGVDQRRACRLSHGIGRDFQVSGPRTTAGHRREGPSHRGGKLVGLSDPLRVLGDGPDYVELVVYFVGEAVAPTDGVPVDLARYLEHRR